MQDRRTNILLSSGPEQEAENQTGEDTIMSEAQFFDYSNCRRRCRRCDPWYNPEEHTDARMVISRDHVHQLPRRPVSEDAEKLDLAADYI